MHQPDLNTFFDESTQLAALTRAITTLKGYLLPARSRHINEFQETLTAMTKQMIEGMQVEEKTRLKFHYTVGELEETNRLAPIFNNFLNTLVHAVQHIKLGCIVASETYKGKNRAHDLNAYFIDEIIQTTEAEFRRILADLEQTKKRYTDELLLCSIALITNSLPLEEEQKLKEKQAFYVGKSEQLQTQINTIAQQWTNPYGTSFYSLLHDLRMEFYQFLVKNSDNTIKKD